MSGGRCTFGVDSGAFFQELEFLVFVFEGDLVDVGGEAAEGGQFAAEGFFDLGQFEGEEGVGRVADVEFFEGEDVSELANKNRKLTECSLYDRINETNPWLLFSTSALSYNYYSRISAPISSPDSRFTTRSPSFPPF